MSVHMLARMAPNLTTENVNTHAYLDKKVASDINEPSHEMICQNSPHPCDVIYIGQQV